MNAQVHFSHESLFNELASSSEEDDERKESNGDKHRALTMIKHKTTLYGDTENHWHRFARQSSGLLRKIHSSESQKYCLWTCEGHDTMLPLCYVKLSSSVFRRRCLFCLLTKHPSSVVPVLSFFTPPNKELNVIKRMISRDNMTVEDTCARLGNLLSQQRWKLRSQHFFSGVIKNFSLVSRHINRPPRNCCIIQLKANLISLFLLSLVVSERTRFCMQSRFCFNYF